jgi:hypothetical protein
LGKCNAESLQNEGMGVIETAGNSGQSAVDADQNDANDEDDWVFLIRAHPRNPRLKFFSQSQIPQITRIKNLLHPSSAITK